MKFKEAVAEKEKLVSKFRTVVNNFCLLELGMSWENSKIATDNFMVEIGLSSTEIKKAVKEQRFVTDCHG